MRDGLVQRDDHMLEHVGFRLLQPWIDRAVGHEMQMRPAYVFHTTTPYLLGRNGGPLPMRPEGECALASSPKLAPLVHNLSTCRMFGKDLPARTFVHRR